MKVDLTHDELMLLVSNLDVRIQMLQNTLADGDNRPFLRERCRDLAALRGKFNTVLSQI